MPLLNGEIARVTPNLTFGAEDDVQNSWHMVKVSGANNDTAVVLAIQEYMEAVYLTVNANIADDILYNSIDIFLITGSQALGKVPWLTLVNGGDIGDPTAPGVCNLVLGRTGISKRIGKKYFGVSTEGKMTGARWVAGYVTDALDAAVIGWENFTATNSVTLRGIVYDRVAMVARDVVTAVATNNPAYQRRRRAGAGS